MPMTRSDLRLAGRSLLLAAAMLTAPPSPAAHPVDVRAVSGVPQVAIATGRALAWRNVGVIAESDLVDVDAKVAACLPGAASPPSGSVIADCTGASSSGAASLRGHQLGVTLKVPRWHERAPWIDLALRGWRSPFRAGVGRETDAGSGATMTVTHPLGPIDAFYGGSTPVAAAGAPGKWRSAFAGLSWRASNGAAIEWVADRGYEAATGAVDRRFTLQWSFRASARGLRIGGHATHAPDDPAGRFRAGVGIDYAF